MQRGGLLEALRKPTFRDWAKKLKHHLQRGLNIFLDYILQKIRWTGINGDGKLVLACPQYGNSDACIHVSLKDARALTWVLMDTERSATFSCLTNTCLLGETRLVKCQNTPCPRWQNRVSALSTSVCQYRWLGADDWKKLPSGELQEGLKYWMGTHEDKQRVRIEVSFGQPVRLTISDSSTRWRFVRRAWERIERLREVSFMELRERGLMAEDHARDVVIVRESGA